MKDAAELFKILSVDKRIEIIEEKAKTSFCYTKPNLRVIGGGSLEGKKAEHLENFVGVLKLFDHNHADDQKEKRHNDHRHKVGIGRTVFYRRRGWNHSSWRFGNGRRRICRLIDSGVNRLGQSLRNDVGHPLHCAENQAHADGKSHDIDNDLLQFRVHFQSSSSLSVCESFDLVKKIKSQMARLAS